MSSDQSHGLMTHRSGRHKDREINLVIVQGIAQCWCKQISYLACRVNAAHKGVGPPRKLANFAPGHERPQGINWEDSIDVLPSRGHVVGEMRGT